MPTYDYRCTECGHMFEEFQSMSAEHLKKCPNCGKDGLKRVLGGGGGMIFKGQGFYLTDYRKGGNGSSSGNKKESAPEKDSSKTTRKSDSESGPQKPKTGSKETDS